MDVDMNAIFLQPDISCYHFNLIRFFGNESQGDEQDIDIGSSCIGKQLAKQVVMLSRRH